MVDNKGADEGKTPCLRVQLHCSDELQLCSEERLLVCFLFSLEIEQKNKVCLLVVVPKGSNSDQKKCGALSKDRLAKIITKTYTLHLPLQVEISPSLSLQKNLKASFYL